MSTLQLRARDGHTLSAYVAKPEGTPRGAVVVVQEIFGVNSHVRRVVEQYAAQGYVAIAPAMFDRFEKDVNLAYDAQGIEQGIAYMMRTTDATTLSDLRAAIDAVAHAGRVGMVGYCWGGRSTYLAACHTDIAAGVAYAIFPERRFVPLLTTLGVVVFGAGVLGTVTGFTTTFGSAVEPCLVGAAARRGSRMSPASSSSIGTRSRNSTSRTCGRSWRAPARRRPR